MILLEFPDMATAMRWYDSADYKAAKDLRHTSATSRVTAVKRRTTHLERCPPEPRDKKEIGERGLCGVARTGDQGRLGGGGTTAMLIATLSSVCFRAQNVAIVRSGVGNR